jgi:hypothetical protein
MIPRSDAFIGKMSKLGFKCQSRYWPIVQRRGEEENISISETVLVQMAKKRVKKRTHVKKVDNPADPKIPKSFVIRTGKTTADPASSVLAQLVLDVRKIMEPNTATRLRVWLIPFF